MIESFHPVSDKNVYIAIDSWYTSEKIIETGLSRGFHVIGAVKSNRVFRLHEHGREHKLPKYVSNLRKSSFEKISLNAFMVRRRDVYLNGSGLITLVIIKRLKDGSMRSIISTDRNLSTSDILKIYSYRWDIEVGYLYLKDRLGIGHYQMRKLEAIKKYCALVFAAYCLLEILRITDNQKNIGKSRKIFTIMKKRTYADTVIELSKKGVPKQEIYKRLKLTA